MRTLKVRTFGSQVNVHDSERFSGLLESAGDVPAVEGIVADVVAFNTCAVRENADSKLTGNLSHLTPVKAENPGMRIAGGGCLAQTEKDRRPGEILAGPAASSGSASPASTHVTSPLPRDFTGDVIAAVASRHVMGSISVVP